MSKRILFLVTAVSALAAIAACFDSGSAASDAPDAALQDSGGTDGSHGDASGIDASPNDAGQADDSPSDAPLDVPMTPECTFYCNQIMTSCTGANAQYPSTASCAAVCATFPVGSVNDTSGETLGCRQHHVLAAQSAAATECTNAGPTGGDLNKPDAGPPVCGSGCAAFCDIAMAVCTGTNKQFADKSVCLTLACPTYAPIRSPPYSIADTATNDFGCRMYHVTAAAESAANAATHCPHIVPNSSVCTMSIAPVARGVFRRFLHLHIACSSHTERCGL